MTDPISAAIDQGTLIITEAMRVDRHTPGRELDERVQTSVRRLGLSVCQAFIEATTAELAEDGKPRPSSRSVARK